MDARIEEITTRSAGRPASAAASSAGANARVGVHEPDQVGVEHAPEVVGVGVFGGAREHHAGVGDDEVEVTLDRVQGRAVTHVGHDGVAAELLSERLDAVAPAGDEGDVRAGGGQRAGGGGADPGGGAGDECVTCHAGHAATGEAT